jgi:type IV pilus assembly protein PilA
MKTQKGFTLIELMIVIAIVGVLATLAIPMLTDYLVRARVTEGVTVASSAKATISENIANNGGLTGSCNGVNTNISATKNVAGLTCVNGTVTVTMTSIAKEVVLTMAPQQLVNDGDSIEWQCSTAEKFQKYVPAECRNTTAGGGGGGGDPDPAP